MDKDLICSGSGISAQKSFILSPPRSPLKFSLSCWLSIHNLHKEGWFWHKCAAWPGLASTGGSVPSRPRTPLPFLLYMPFLPRGWEQRLQGQTEYSFWHWLAVRHPEKVIYFFVPQFLQQQNAKYSSNKCVRMWGWNDSGVELLKQPWHVAHVRHCPLFPTLCRLRLSLLNPTGVSCLWLIYSIYHTAQKAPIYQPASLQMEHKSHLLFHHLCQHPAWCLAHSRHPVTADYVLEWTTSSSKGSVLTKGCCLAVQ